jgi:hypothetical protein
MKAFFMDLKALKMKVTHSYKTQGTTYQIMQHHIPEKLKFLLQRAYKKKKRLLG